ncbi:hypothetical protein [Methylobacter sp.]|uniref:hypothetical protein n=1 Tax=Methylobacter sp. TaxID=2051955 RepID=UPI003DA506CA
MTELLEFLKEFNIQTILSMGVIVWYFTRDLKSQIFLLDKDLQAMNIRLSRAEGTLYGKDLYKGDK